MLQFTRQERKVFLFIFSLVAFGLVLSIMGKATGRRDCFAQLGTNLRQPLAINVNRASVEELVDIKGIGLATAQAIVDYRRTHGEFKRLEDLMSVKGIKEARLEKLRPYLKCNAHDALRTAHDET